MRILKQGLVLCLAVLGTLCVAQEQGPAGQFVPAQADHLFALANQARMQNGARQLTWDDALAEAARRHCMLMAQEGPIAHRYGGELGLAERAGQAGARFSLIEENVALGPTAEEIHEEWMHSPGHRANLLNPQVNRVGIAVVASRGELYAVADYSTGVAVLKQSQVERQVERLIRVSGVEILNRHEEARAACRTNSGLPSTQGGPMPRFVMRWQDPDLKQLPQALADRLASGNYRAASVGSCPAEGLHGSFSAYRIAVLLY
jgi:hypothetical protein